MGYKLLQTPEVKRAGRRLLSLPGGQNFGLKKSKEKPKDISRSARYKTWRDIDGELSGGMIFFKKECPECWIKGRESLLLLALYHHVPILTCMNCRFDTSDIP